MNESAHPITGFFVTGTDTGVGKTLVSAALLRRFAAAGRRVAGMKPVASGAIATTQGLRSEDALILLRESSPHAAYEHVNPYALEPPIAPHLAALAAGVTIDVVRIEAAFRALAAAADLVVVEGVGGWRVPLGPDLDVAGLAARLGLPVILVVGLRLGCLPVHQNSACKPQHSHHEDVKLRSRWDDSSDSINGILGREKIDPARVHPGRCVTFHIGNRQAGVGSSQIRAWVALVVAVGMTILGGVAFLWESRRSESLSTPRESERSQCSMKNQLSDFPQVIT